MGRRRHNHGRWGKNSFRQKRRINELKINILTAKEEKRKINDMVKSIELLEKRLEIAEKEKEPYEEFNNKNGSLISKVIKGVGALSVLGRIFQALKWAVEHVASKY
jgi:hypothetical protein